MRRLSIALSALALLGAIGATGYLLTASPYQGVSTGTFLTEHGIQTAEFTQGATSVNGPWIVALLPTAVLISSVPLVIALALPEAQSLGTWLPSLALLGFAVVSGFTVGQFFMPSALTLLAAAVMTGFIRDPSAPSADG